MIRHWSTKNNAHRREGPRAPFFPVRRREGRGGQEGAGAGTGAGWASEGAGTTLILRPAPKITRLLDHPLARILPAEARAEARHFADAQCDPLAAPLRVMQLRHQTAELLREAPVLADQPEATEEIRAARPPQSTLSRRPARMVQMELPLSA